MTAVRQVQFRARVEEVGAWSRLAEAIDARRAHEGQIATASSTPI
jgi:hypothetical protein